MNTIKDIYGKHKTISLLLLLLIIQSCDIDKKPKNKEKENPLEKVKKENVIKIITESMDFQTLDTIPSGWNTFQYVNNSNETHFFLMDKYPEGKTIEDSKREVMPPFQNGMDLINQGKPEESFSEFSKLPEWYSEVVYSGGSGLVSPKNTAITTIKLEPGYYIMECYVKMANGKFHTLMGMSKAIVVIAKDSGNSPPKETINITISSKEGIVYDKPITKGKQTLAVHFKDQIVHENFVGHDVNLVKLANSTDLKTLEKWMNWTNPKGLISPSPEGFIFLGGVNDMPEGSTGYFIVVLEPGDYVLISEVPNTLSKKMLKTFTVVE
ncbi:MAG: hypothetical protein KAT78_05320 [Flavobacteriaceae bacterium]|nr:hypothetical protein [Flavobacteriaceae bacterium]